jgi:hypothetical protein
MDKGPLVNERVEAAVGFLGEFNKYAPVQSAFWLKAWDEGIWWLYVASEQITDENFDVGYGEVLRIADELHDPWFDPFQVKLIGADDPLAKAALALRQRFPGRRPARAFDQAFGGESIEEVYVYPSPLPAPPSDDKAASTVAPRRRRGPGMKK